MDTFDLIIHNGYIVNSESSFYGSIGIKNGKIVEIATGILNEDQTAYEIDAKGLHILPGLIDTHVHLNEPGTDWEGFETGTKSMAAGGITTFFDMPLSSIPATTSSAGYLAKKKVADQKSIINYRLWGGLVPNSIHLLEEQRHAGVIGFKAFMSATGIEEFENVDDQSLLEGMAKIAELDSILAVHAESDVITKYLTDYMISNKKFSARDFSESRPVISEIEAIQRLLVFAEITGCRLHICHISSGEVLTCIMEAKAKGVDVTVETCPHYLTFTIEDFEQQGTLLKCNPPLRDQAHLESLWAAIEKGEIDTIASDHSPSPLEMKENKDGNIFETWSGISGVQTTLNVLLEEGYWKRNISLNDIVRITATNPAKRFGLDHAKGRIQIGHDADLTIIDLNEKFTLSTDDLYYRHKEKNPYIGKEFRGKVLYTLVNGKVVYDQRKK